MPKAKTTKRGICEVHLYNNEEKKKTKVRWSVECQMWVCDECDDPVLKATACINKKIHQRKNKHNG